jgi:hypothetical protein
MLHFRIQCFLSSHHFKKCPVTDFYRLRPTHRIKACASHTNMSLPREKEKSCAVPKMPPNTRNHRVVIPSSWFCSVGLNVTNKQGDGRIRGVVESQTQSAEWRCSSPIRVGECLRQRLQRAARLQRSVAMVLGCGGKRICERAVYVGLPFRTWLGCFPGLDRGSDAIPRGGRAWAHDRGEQSRCFVPARPRCAQGHGPSRRMVSSFSRTRQHHGAMQSGFSIPCGPGYSAELLRGSQVVSRRGRAGFRRC